MKITYNSDHVMRKAPSQNTDPLKSNTNPPAKPNLPPKTPTPKSNKSSSETRKPHPNQMKSAQQSKEIETLKLSLITSIHETFR
jgi:hypothetical protein